MKIYNYLFYKTYILAKRSGNFNDTPILGGILFVIPCVMFNIFTIMFLIEANEIKVFYFSTLNRVIFGIVLVATILAYYYYNGRYKKIIEKFETQKKGKFQLHPIIVIIIYYALSFCLLLLSGLYKNHDWIFA